MAAVPSIERTTDPVAWRPWREKTSVVHLAGRRSWVAKRALDIVVGGLAAIAAIPVIFGLAVALAITLRSWPIFIQRRIGKDGRHFSMIKLRTLPKSTPSYALKTELSCRISRLAKILRKHHLDELPQLFLVPLGKLSLVGPRPKMPDAVEMVDEIYGLARVQVPQGCTGLWQISPHKVVLPREAPEYDFFYVRHGSVLLDGWILAKTVLIALHLSKPVELVDVPRWILRDGSFADVTIDLTRHVAEVDIALA